MDILNVLQCPTIQMYRGLVKPVKQNFINMITIHFYNSVFLLNVENVFSFEDIDIIYNDIDIIYNDVFMSVLVIITMYKYM